MGDKLTIEPVDPCPTCHRSSAWQMIPAQHPHKCPACDGWCKRQDPSAPASSGGIPMVTCPACKGAGVVWR